MQSEADLVSRELPDVVKAMKWPPNVATFPLPHYATWGNTQVLSTKKGVLPESCCKKSCISTVFRVDIQHVLPCSQNPLGRYGDEPEDKSLYATRFLESESLGVDPAHDVLVEIVYQCSKQEKDGVLCHERLWESVPSESVIHIIEYTLLAATQVVEFNDISDRRLVVVGQNAAVGVFAFPQVKFSVCIPLSLDDKAIAFALPWSEV